MHLSPELLAQIQAAIADGSLNVHETSTRSPIKPRQLHDLRILPRADDPRPTFFWSAEAPRNAPDLTKTSEFPKLMWEGRSGTEITVASWEAQQEHLQMGYTFTAPSQEPLDPLEALRAQWAALPPEDQVQLMESQRRDRLVALQQQLADLPEALLADLLQSVPSTAVVHRGPGRPRKEVA